MTDVAEKINNASRNGEQQSYHYEIMDQLIYLAEIMGLEDDVIDHLPNA